MELGDSLFLLPRESLRIFYDRFKDDPVAILHNSDSGSFEEAVSDTYLRWDIEESVFAERDDDFLLHCR